MIPTGDRAPRFCLQDLEGRRQALEDLLGRRVVLNFWSAECPWARRADPVVAAAARGAGVEVWTIACCAGEPLDDIRREASARRLGTVLLDPDQSVVDAYDARATPHVFVIDEHGILRYQGAPDDTGFGFTSPTVDYLSSALRALAEGRDPDPAETPARGCAIVRRVA
jgi:peroxiredoxin